MGHQVPVGVNWVKVEFLQLESFSVRARTHTHTCTHTSTPERPVLPSRGNKDPKRKNAAPEVDEAPWLAKLESRELHGHRGY